MKIQLYKGAIFLTIMNKYKVLILGGTGTLSKQVAFESIKKNNFVYCLNRGTHDNEEGVIFIKGDFYNLETWLNKIKPLEFDIIIDFLSRTKEDIERVCPFLLKKCKQYIFISSACVYDRKNNTPPYSELNTMPDNRWAYSIEKYECEQLLMSLSKKYSSCYTIVRPYITYDKKRIPIGLAPQQYSKHRTIIERIKAGKPMFVTGCGNVKTTVTCYLDFARAIIGLYFNEKAYNEDFTLTSSYVYTNKQLLQIVFDYLCVKRNIVEVDDSNFLKTFPHYKEIFIADRKYDETFDNTKILKVLDDNFCFEGDFEKEIKRIVDYYSNEKRFEYDYAYDALCDKLIQKKNKSKLFFIRYPHSPNNAVFEYFLFRYLPYNLAIFLKRKFKL